MTDFDFIILVHFIGIVIALFFAFTLWRMLWEGKVRHGFFTYTREKQPIRYWWAVGGTAMAGAIFGAIAIYAEVRFLLTETGVLP